MPVPSKTKLFGIFLAASQLLAACATSNVDKDFSLESRPGEGLVAVSVSYEGLGSEVSPVWEYHSLDGDISGKIFTSSLNALDWKTPPGRLAVFTLPAGRYQFDRCRFVRVSGVGGTSWHVGGSGGVTNSNPAYSGFGAGNVDDGVADPFSVKFEVTPGRATYIGNLHLRWQITAERGEHGTVVIRDQSERDIQLFLERYPNIRREQIAIQTKVVAH